MSVHELREMDFTVSTKILFSLPFMDGHSSIDLRDVPKQCQKIKGWENTANQLHPKQTRAPQQRNFNLKQPPAKTLRPKEASEDALTSTL